MQQATRAAGCPIGKISLVDYQYPVAGRAELLRRAGAVDTCADNRNVEM